MNSKNSQLQSNLAFLLYNTSFQSHSNENKKSSVINNLRNSDNLLIKMTKIQVKLYDYISFCFNKLKHNMKSLQNRDLIYQAIYKSSPLKLQNIKDKKNQLQIEQQQKNNQNQKILTTKSKINQEDCHILQKVENHVQIPKKPSSAKQFNIIKFSSIYNTQQKINNVNQYRQQTVKRIISKTEQNQQITQKKHKVKKNNQSRDLNYVQFQDNFFIPKRGNQQIYLIKNNNPNKNKEKIIRFTKIQFEPSQFNSFYSFENKKKGQQQIKNQKLYDSKILASNCKQMSLQKFQQKKNIEVKFKNNFKLNLSIINSKRIKIQKKINHCKYCATIDRAKKLVYMHTDRTFTNNSSFY